MAGSGGEGGNCIAVVIAAQLAQEDAPPAAVFFRGDGELERGLAGGVAEDRGTAEQAPAQGGQFGALGLAQQALEPDAEVVGADGQVAGRLGGPERAQAEALSPNWAPRSLMRLSMSARPL